MMGGKRQESGELATTRDSTATKRTAASRPPSALRRAVEYNTELGKIKRTWGYTHLSAIFPTVLKICFE